MRQPHSRYSGRPIRKRYCATVIPRNTDLRDAHFNKTDIYSCNPRAKAALAYEKLIREVFLPDLKPAKNATQTYEETT